MFSNHLAYVKKLVSAFSLMFNFINLTINFQLFIEEINQINIEFDVLV